jgi:serine/threonine-protein kinase HipA
MASWSLRFGTQRVLGVTRFDRQWMGADEAAVSARGYVPNPSSWIARLPQEDLCQASGLPPIQKYEADGGPWIEDVLQILAGSESPEVDRADFVLAQLAFWLLAATDGHAKNISIHHHAGGSYRMTPLYDVLSAWPIIGNRAHQLSIQDAQLAMAVQGRSRHYKLLEIQSRHWHALAVRAGVPGLWRRMTDMVESAETIMDSVLRGLPGNFPERIAATIDKGVRKQAQVFLRGEMIANRVPTASTRNDDGK